MSSDADYGLETFVQRFLASQGAVIEKRGPGLDVLAPQKLTRSIGIPEFCSLAIGTEAREGFAIHYGSALLEKMANAACETIPLTIMRLSFHYIKSQGFDRLIDVLFRFRGALVRVENTAEVQTEYIVLTCRYLAQSDEQKEGLVSLGYNLETGAPVGNLQTLLDVMEKDVETGSSRLMLEEEKIGHIIQWVKGRAPKLLEQEIQSFRDSMNRRFQRDVINLEEYYRDLDAEMTQALMRPGLSEQLIQERKDKIALIPQELAKKKDDLFKKYSIKIKLRLSGALLIRTPAVKLFCRATIGRRPKNLTLSYNPIDKSLDPLVCTNCGEGSYQIAFNGQLDPICPVCVS
jgi:hypothetical protein